MTQVPESIGFLPYMGFAGSGSQLSPMAGSTEMTKIDLGKDRGFEGAHAWAYKGTSQSWPAQLLSPALSDWLARSEDDWGFELAGGVLCAGRSGYLTAAGDLETVCEDAAHIAGAIRQESVEEVEGGDAQLDAAKDPDAADSKMEKALAKVKTEPPTYLTAALPAYRRYSRGSADTFLRALRYALLLTLVLNIPGAAIPIVLIVQGAYAWLIGIEAALFPRHLLLRLPQQDPQHQPEVRGGGLLPQLCGAARIEAGRAAPLRRRPRRSEAAVQAGPGDERAATGRRRRLARPLRRRQQALGPDRRRHGAERPGRRSGAGVRIPRLATKDLDTFLAQLAGEAREDKATAPTA